MKDECRNWYNETFLDSVGANFNPSQPSGPVGNPVKLDGPRRRVPVRRRRPGAAAAQDQQQQQQPRRRPVAAAAQSPPPPPASTGAGSGQIPRY